MRGSNSEGNIKHVGLEHYVCCWRCLSKGRIKQIAIQCLCFLGTYFLSATLAASRSTATPWITTRLDNMVPFWPAWVWIYLSAYSLDTAGLCLAVWGVSERLFRIVLTACYVNLLLATMFHVGLPFVAIKPTIPGTTVSDSAMAVVQRLTTRWNTFPSLHVSYSLITSWAAAKGFRNHKLISVFLIGNAALIVPATLFVKEHTALDVCGGIMLAASSLMIASALLPANEEKLPWRRPQHGESARHRESTEEVPGSRIGQTRIGTE